MRVTGRRRIAASGRGVGQDLKAAVHRDLTEAEAAGAIELIVGLSPGARGSAVASRRPERRLAWAGVPRRTGWENRCRAAGSG